MLVDGSDGEAVSVELEEGSEDGKVGKGGRLRRVRPEDDRGGIAILCREYGMEECYLPVGQREEVVSPVGVEDCVFREDHARKRISRQGRRKVVAVPAERHVHARMNVDEGRGSGERGVVGGRCDSRGVEAGGRGGADGKNRLANPSAREELDLDVHLVRPHEEQDLREERSVPHLISWRERGEREQHARLRRPVQQHSAMFSSSATPSQLHPAAACCISSRRRETR